MDTELVERWQNERDEEAVVELWRQYHPLAVRVAAHILRTQPDPEAEAADVVDGCFPAALRSFDPARASSGSARPFRAWLLRLVRHAAIDRRRRSSGSPTSGAAALVLHEPEQQLAARLDLDRVLPQLRAYVLDHFLPSDWKLVEAWLHHCREGRRVPWAALAEHHPLRIETVLRFAPDSLAFPAEALDPVVRLMDRCIATHVDVLGTVHGEHPSILELAQRRVSAVAAVLCRRIRNERSLTGGSMPRVGLRTQPGPPHEVHFDVVQGAVRSPAALRMRVTKVILPRARAHLRSLEGVPPAVDGHRVSR